MRISFNGRKVELDEEAARELEEAIMDVFDDEDTSLRGDYSGRGMYGDTCVGVVGKAGVEIAFAFALMRVIDDNDLESEIQRDLKSFLALNCRSDNMGRDMIYYWPGIQIV